MSRIRIIVPTQLLEEEYRNTNYYKALIRVCHSSQSVHECHITILENNSIGLSQLYNDYLRLYTSPQNATDIIVFMHDDLEIHDAYFVEKLVKAHQSYDIVGLAGATSQDYSGNTPAWHLCLKQPRDGRGFVSHYIPNPGYYNSAFFGPTPAQVLLIDGLFMSFNLQKLDKLFDEGRELFDPEFSFHFYDMAMCVNAHGYGISVGVWPIFAIHSGLGDFNADPLWHKLAVKFKEKYGTYNESL